MSSVPVVTVSEPGSLSLEALEAMTATWYMTPGVRLDSTVDDSPPSTVTLRGLPGGGAQSTPPAVSINYYTA